MKWSVRCRSDAAILADVQGAGTMGYNFRFTWPKFSHLRCISCLERRLSGDVAVVNFQNLVPVMQILILIVTDHEEAM